MNTIGNRLENTEFMPTMEQINDAILESLRMENHTLRKIIGILVRGNGGKAEITKEDLRTIENGCLLWQEDPFTENIHVLYRSNTFKEKDNYEESK